MCRSLWQTPVATVRTRTSRPHGLSTSTSSIVSGACTCEDGGFHRPPVSGASSAPGSSGGFAAAIRSSGGFGGPSPPSMYPSGWPAFTASTWPEMLRAMSLQKNSVASTMSSAVTKRLRGDCLDHRLAHLLDRDPAHLRLAGDDAVDAVAVHRARRHAVHADVGRQLERHPVRHARPARPWRSSSRCDRAARAARPPTRCSRWRPRPPCASRARRSACRDTSWSGRSRWCSASPPSCTPRPASSARRRPRC